MTDDELEERFKNFDQFATEISETFLTINRSLETMYRAILELQKHTKIKEPKLIVQ
jgi:hypothetical protein